MRRTDNAHKSGNRMENSLQKLMLPLGEYCTNIYCYTFGLGADFITTSMSSSDAHNSRKICKKLERVQRTVLMVMKETCLAVGVSRSSVCTNQDID